jgi:hypothetical protein
LSTGSSDFLDFDFDPLWLLAIVEALFGFEGGGAFADPVERLSTMVELEN